MVVSQLWVVLFVVVVVVLVVHVSVAIVGGWARGLVPHSVHVQSPVHLPHLQQTLTKPE